MPTMDQSLEARGLSRFTGDGVAAPVSNLSYAAGAAGGLTGQYYYTVTYVTATGETSPWIGTPPKVAFANQAANLTNIPVGPAGTVARRIYRSVANEVQDKRVYLLATINDNTTTTYVDTAADAALGDAPQWTPTNTGVLNMGAVTGIAVGGQSIAIGEGPQPGYASIAIGYKSQQGGRAGLRNTSMGVYALQNVTVGYGNTAVGTHSGNGIESSSGNSFFGYSSGGISAKAGDFNTAIGFQAMNGSTLAAGAALGGGCTVVGAFAAERVTAAWNNLIAIGRDAGKYAAGARRLYIDSIDRATDAGCQDNGIIYGEMDASAANQRLRFNGIARLGSINAATAGALPAASAALRGYRGFVTDATVAYTGANIGTTVAGGGANVVPVFCNGVNWVIG